MIHALVLALALTATAPQRLAGQPLEPQLEERVTRLGKQLRCAVCQGLSIADSPSSMARAQLETVRTLVAEGKSDEEIRQYFVDRYGQWALLSPPVEGFNWVVWLGPAVIILFGALIIFQLLRRKGAPGEAAAAGTPSASPPTAAPEEDPYLAAVRKELEK